MDEKLRQVGMNLTLHQTDNWPKYFHCYLFKRWFLIFVCFQLDSALIHLEARLNETRMGRYVNVVILSDHGMTYGHNPEQDDLLTKKIRLTEHLQHGTYRSVSSCCLSMQAAKENWIKIQFVLNESGPIINNMISSLNQSCCWIRKWDNIIYQSENWKSRKTFVKTKIGRDSFNFSIILLFPFLLW